jgi:micrococcal nuclease
LRLYPILIGVVFFVALLFSQNVWSSDSTLLQGKVLRVYDGDTIQVEKVGEVRLIGIDAPEWKASDRDRYYLRQGISAATLRRIATMSRQFLRRHVAGQTVTLEVDSAAQDHRDKYGRLLAYVTLEDGRMLNRMLIEAGMASVYRRFNFRLKNDFLKAEQLAKKQSLGLWNGLKEQKK